MDQQLTVPNTVKQFQSLEKSAAKIRLLDLNRIIEKPSLKQYDQSSRKIVDIDCQTGCTTASLVASFPSAFVMGIDSDENMIHYAQNHYKQSGHFIKADVRKSDFSQPLKHYAGEPFADLVTAIHSFQMMDPNIETILANLNSILKPDGILCATFSFWSDLFRIGNEVFLSDDMSLRLSDESAYKFTKPDWPKEMDKLKQLLAKYRFRTDNLSVMELVEQRIEFDTLKRIQDCIRFIYPLTPFVPESKRLRFFSKFFDNVYDHSMSDGWQQEHETYHFRYQYISLRTAKYGPGNQ